jgi:hypothetical protein
MNPTFCASAEASIQSSRVVDPTLKTWQTPVKNGAIDVHAFDVDSVGVVAWLEERGRFQDDVFQFRVKRCVLCLDLKPFLYV